MKKRYGIAEFGFLISITGVVVYSACADIKRFTQTQMNSQTYSRALEQAQELIDELDLDPADFQHMIEFIEFYLSWYAPVTPAPYTLRESLSPTACTFIDELKAITKVFECTTPTKRLGASRLSQEGKNFYNEILEILREKRAALE